MLVAGLLVLAIPAFAEDDVSDVQGRVSVGVEKKIVKGLSVSLEEQVRFSNKFSTLDRLHTDLALEYKVNRYFRIGVGTILINNYKPNTRNWVHKERFYLDLTGRYKAGIVEMSLKERLQLTHRFGSFNTAETTPNLLGLKSRFKVAVDLKKLEPYAYFEARTVFNGPTGTVGTYDDEEQMWEYTATGYKDVYFDRFRASAGLKWKINTHNALDLFFLGDYVQSWKIDTDKSQAYLKSKILEKGFISHIGIGYTFKF